MQLLVGPLKASPHLLWVDETKAIPSKSWFERNQHLFQDKPLPWLNRPETAHVKASSWYSISKLFAEYST